MRFSAVLLSCLLGLSLAACGDDDVVAPGPTGAIEIHFLQFVGAEPLELDTIKYTNEAGNMYSVETLRYYISNVAVRGPDGAYETDLVHYVDVDDDGTMELRIEGVPERHYHKLEFTFGLDAEHNQTGAIPDAPVQMKWPDPMGGGYHYLMLEGKFMKDGIPTGYPFHTGRFRETDGSMSHHFFTASMDLHRTVVANQTLHAEVIMDVNEWFANPNTIDLTTILGGIMANTAAQDLIEQNGAGVFRLGDVEGGADGDEDHE